jgi:hypothetical protein
MSVNNSFSNCSVKLFLLSAVISEHLLTVASLNPLKFYGWVEKFISRMTYNKNNNLPKPNSMLLVNFHGFIHKK